MFNIDFTRTALSVIGALIFSVTAVSAAVGPARVVETTPVVYAEVAPIASGAANA
jgi:hypothetical protein